MKTRTLVLTLLLAGGAVVALAPAASAVELACTSFTDPTCNDYALCVGVTRDEAGYVSHCKQELAWVRCDPGPCDPPVE